jgi:hypothetical protein
LEFEVLRVWSTWSLECLEFGVFGVWSTWSLEYLESNKQLNF